MLPNRTATAFCALLVCALALPSAAEAALVTYFSFNSETPLIADLGTGTITIGGPTTSPAVTFVGGTTLNAEVVPPAVAPAAGNALAIDNNGGNTTWIDIAFKSLGYADLQLSFAAEGSNSTYTLANVQYWNGSTYVDAAPSITFDPSQQGTWHIPSNQPIDLSNVTALNNMTNAQLRLVLTGANANPDPRLLIDNLQINGTAAPEAPALAMMGVALLLFGGVAYRRRRAAAGQTVHAQVLAA